MIAVIPADTLAPYQRGGKTRAEMARELGVSERHLRRLLARERETCARIADVLNGRDRDRFDYLYMEITECVPDDPANEWCTEASSAISLERGTVHVGGQIRSVRGGYITKNGAEADAEEIAKEVAGRPKPSFRPHQRQRQPKRLTVEELQAIKAKGGRKKGKRAG